MRGAPRIAVIGAGLSGLTAAWHLRQAGLNPVVLEAQPQPGGRMRSMVSSGMIHDLGAWTYIAGGETDQLAQALGLTSSQIVIPATLGRPVGGRLRVGNLRNPLTLVGTAFTPGEILHAIRAFHLAGTLPAQTPDEIAGVWAARSFPPAFIASVLTPLAGLFFLQSLDHLSRNALLGTLRYLARIRLMSFRWGMGYLASRLASTLDLRYGLAVQSLQPEGGGIRVRGSGFSQYFDGVLVATPLPEALQLMCAWLDAPIRQSAGNWPHAAALVVRFLLKRQFVRPALQVFPPRGHVGWACGATMERAKHPFRVPARQEALSFYVRPENAVSLASRRDRDIAAIMAGELRAWLGVSGIQIAASWIQRWPYAVGFNDPMTSPRVAALKAHLHRLSCHAPIWVAGDYLGAASLEGAVETAGAAARDCRIYFQSGPL